MGNTAESHAMQSQSTQLYKRAVAGTTLLPQCLYIVLSLAIHLMLFQVKSGKQFYY